MPAIAANIVDVYVFRRLPGGVEFLQLLRRPDLRLGQTWQSVHGRIEPGETAVAAALRELAEETGLRPIRFWQLERVNTFFLAAADTVMLCPGFAAEVEPAAVVRLCQEHTEYRWLAADGAAAQFMWPGQRDAIAEIVTELIPGGLGEPYQRIELKPEAASG